MSQLSETFTTLADEAHVEFEEKKSLFIGHALRTDTEQEAQEYIKKIKKQYNDATHNVSAYSINNGIIARYSDDGEPQGTSGMPTLDAIRKSGVDNACGKLLVNLCPRVLEGYGAVEDKVAGSRVLIYIEVTDSLELQVVEWLSICQILLDIALCKNSE